MDLSSPTPTPNSPLVPVFGDNVQDLLGRSALNVNPTGIIVVNSTADAIDDPNSGVTTLRDAISQANADSGEDLIVFDRSLFSTAQTITLNSGELDITHSLDIIAPLDTLTGGDLVTVSGNNASRVLEIGTGASVNIDGLIVADGKVTGRDGGGGILNSGILTLDNSIVRNDYAVLVTDNIRAGAAFVTENGGGILNSGNLTLDNSIVSGSKGGGIFNTVGTVEVNNSIISGNSSNTNSGKGGGISNNTGTVEVNNSTISGNTSFGNGGGIYNDTGTVEVNNSTISANTSSSVGNGGGISNNTGTVEVNNSTISGNALNFGNGGGISNNTGIVEVNNSTISGNTSFGNGGGIYNDTGTVEVNNSTISGNKVSGIYGGNGGGIYNYYTGTLTLLFSTVTQNQAANGGGIYQNEVPLSYPPNPVRGSNNLRNTIIAANLTTDGGINPDVSGTFTSNDYNLIGDNTGSTGFGVTGDIVGTTDNPIDPLLAPLAFNGGSTQTVALIPGSPAIGAADPTILDTDPITDQRGLPRRAADSSADIGAYELS